MANEEEMLLRRGSIRLEVWGAVGGRFFETWDLAYAHAFTEARGTAWKHVVFRCEGYWVSLWLTRKWRDR